MKILTVIGARPQFIKAAMVSRAFAEYGINELILHTGQHFDDNMSEVFFREMNIPKPVYNLGINGLPQGAATGRMMEGIEDAIFYTSPDYVLVYGDTNSTLAGALAAKKQHVGLIHVEAGLRSFNMTMQEEINRVVTDRISDLLFCPTSEAVKNLKEENCKGRIVDSGDLIEDAVLHYGGTENGPCNYLLCTIHRAENTDDEERLSGIVEAINLLSRNHRVVVPLHPRTRKKIEDLGLKLNGVIEPVGYKEMLSLIKGAKLVLTDSGGLQKEAFILGKFCVVMRNETEWVELVENGYAFLAGHEKEVITTAVHSLWGKPFHKNHNFYGGGKATKIICETISGL